MGAPKGNNYWEFRSKDGTEPKYTPETLWNRAVEYFQWVIENPLWESVLVAKGIIINKGTENETIVYSTTLPKMRAMTLKAFQIFADISHTTWDNYSANKDYIAITTRVKDIIYSQKFEGAAATLLNPNLIARELGLKEQAENTNKNTIEYINVSKQFPDK